MCSGGLPVVGGVGGGGGVIPGTPAPVIAAPRRSGEYSAKTKKQKLAKGQSGTILTGGLGDTSAVLTGGKKRMLGE